MDGHQDLTVEQLQLPEGVATLNEMLRTLFESGRESSFIYSLSGSQNSDIYGKWGETQASSTVGLYMPLPGSIVHHSLNLNITTATSDSINAQVRINDSEKTDLSLSFPSTLGTGIAKNVISVPRHSVTFSKGDIIQIFFDEVGSTGSMVWQDTIGFIKVIFDDAEG